MTPAFLTPRCPSCGTPAGRVGIAVTLDDETRNVCECPNKRCRCIAFFGSQKQKGASKDGGA